MKVKLYMDFLIQSIITIWHFLANASTSLEYDKTELAYYYVMPHQLEMFTTTTLARIQPGFICPSMTSLKSPNQLCFCKQPLERSEGKNSSATKGTSITWWCAICTPTATPLFLPEVLCSFQHGNGPLGQAIQRQQGEMKWIVSVSGAITSDLLSTAL